MLGPGPSIKPIFAGPIQSILQPILAYFQAQFRPKGNSSQGAINNPNRGPTEATQAGFVPSSHPLYHRAPKASLSNQQASGPRGFSHPHAPRPLAFPFRLDFLLLCNMQPCHLASCIHTPQVSTPASSMPFPVNPHTTSLCNSSPTSPVTSL